MQMWCRETDKLEDSAFWPYITAVCIRDREFGFSAPLPTIIVWGTEREGWDMSRLGFYDPNENRIEIYAPLHQVLVQKERRLDVFPEINTSLVTWELYHTLRHELAHWAHHICGMPYVKETSEPLAMLFEHRTD